MNIRRIARTAAGFTVATAVLFGSASAASAAGSDQLTPYDLDGDGRADTWLGDMDGNGWFDGALFDRNEDDVTDGIAYDSTGNGSFDVYGLDNNQNGYNEIWGVDSNDDGAIDTAYLDMNENGTEDSNEQMYPTSTVVGGTPTYQGVSGLLLTMAHITGKATWGSGDSDKDGIYDSSDYYWDDPAR